MRTTERPLFDVCKRISDFCLSLLGIIVLSPVLLVVAIVVLVAHGRPVLFRQARPGRDAVVFELVKFRTMRHADAADTTDAERLTSVGRFLRATSLDELPTLWNVLKGDMSLVGPRPLLVSYLDRYTPTQARRHEVRPGVTGLAQVAGRNAVDWPAKLALDVEYVDTRSVRRDVDILLGTALLVLRRTGISAPGEATVREYQGVQGENLAIEGLAQ